MAMHGDACIQLGSCVQSTRAQERKHIATHAASMTSSVLQEDVVPCVGGGSLLLYVLRVIVLVPHVGCWTEDSCRFDLSHSQSIVAVAGPQNPTVASVGIVRFTRR
jgi:hypothetical protein